jgi:hypothetical protein
MEGQFEVHTRPPTPRVPLAPVNVGGASVAVHRALHVSIGRDVGIGCFLSTVILNTSSLAPWGGTGREGGG